MKRTGREERYSKKKKWSYDAGFYEDYAPGKRKSLPSSG